MKPTTDNTECTRTERLQLYLRSHLHFFPVLLCFQRCDSPVKCPSPETHSEKVEEKGLRIVVATLQVQSVVSNDSYDHFKWYAHSRISNLQRNCLIGGIHSFYLMRTVRYMVYTYNIYVATMPDFLES